MENRKASLDDSGSRETAGAEAVPADQIAGGGEADIRIKSRISAPAGYASVLNEDTLQRAYAEIEPRAECHVFAGDGGQKSDSGRSSEADSKFTMRQALFSGLIDTGARGEGKSRRRAESDAASSSSVHAKRRLLRNVARAYDLAKAAHDLDEPRRKRCLRREARSESGR